MPCHASEAISRRAIGGSLQALAVLLIVVAAILGSIRVGRAQDGDPGFSPSSGHAHVIAQGIVELPAGDVVWRTVRTRAQLPADAPFEARPLGFVVASSGPLLLIDQASGQQTQLGVGEAAIVPAGTVQQRSSLNAAPVSYLSIELVAAGAASPPEAAIVLQPGQPFPAPAGPRDVNLVSDTLNAGESFAIPDSGQKNVVLITAGAADIGRPGGETVVLLAGEAASFSGALEIAPAADGAYAEGGTSFVVAIIGPRFANPGPPATVEATSAPEETAAAGVGVGAGLGAITVQVFTCPPGMDAETLSAAACAPASSDFDVTLSGAQLPAPLTIGDAELVGDAFRWSQLPFGDYVIAQAVLPGGYSTYILAANDVSGSAEAGYRVSLGEEEPELMARIYNLAP